MGATSVDREFKKYWLRLSELQKESLLSLIKSFIQQNEEINVEQYNLELREAEAEYRAGNYITHEEMLKQLKEWEKKSVLLFIKTFFAEKKQGSKGISIRQYNNEIDEAMKRIDAGEFISHEDLEKESRQW